jgi:hypothetical protein
VASTAVVRPDGIIQRVVLPGPGDFVVTFSYSPPPAAVGLIVSAAAALVLLVWAGSELIAALRRRRRLNRG